MIALFDYCFKRSALHKKYVQTVAEAWGNNKIQTWNDLDLYYQKQEKLVKIKKSIAKKLGKSDKSIDNAIQRIRRKIRNDQES